VGNGLEVVDEPALPAEQGVVLEALERAPDPGLALRRDRQR
jgi:hypothetical protein